MEILKRKTKKIITLAPNRQIVYNVVHIRFNYIAIFYVFVKSCCEVDDYEFSGEKNGNLWIEMDKSFFI